MIAPVNAAASKTTPRQPGCPGGNGSRAGGDHIGWPRGLAAALLFLVHGRTGFLTPPVSAPYDPARMRPVGQAAGAGGVSSIRRDSDSGARQVIRARSDNL